MLISRKYNFIFIANTKAASTTLEHLLQRHCDVAIRRQADGKHWTVQQVRTAFASFFEYIGRPMASFYRFGVIRDPVSWLVSWYNYRSRLAADDPGCTKGIPFGDFVAEVMAAGERKRYARINPQYRKFVDNEERLGVSHLISHEKLSSQLTMVAKDLGIMLPADIGDTRKNASPTVLRLETVAKSMAEDIRRHFALDAFLHRRASEAGSTPNMGDLDGERLVAKDIFSS